MHYRRLTPYLFGVLFVVGCVAPPVRDREVAPPESRYSPPSSIEQSADDNAHRVELATHINGWNQRIDALVRAVEQELGDCDQTLLSERTPDEHRYLTQQKRILLEYQKKLNMIKQAQEQLIDTSGALNREALYVQLIAQYVTCLRIEKKLRADAALGAKQSDALEAIRMQYYNNNYTAVVDLFDQGGGRSPLGAASNEAQTYYAIALYRLGRTEEALRFAEAIVAEGVSVGCANASLIYELGEVLIDSERYDAAEKVFGALIAFYQQEQEMAAKAQKKSALFQTDLAYLRVRNKLDQAIDFFEKGGSFSEAFRLCKDALKACPDPPCRREVHSVLDQFVVKTSTEMERKLHQVDVLMEEGNLLEAYELVAALDRQFPDDGYPALIMKQLDALQEKSARVRQEEIQWKDELERLKYEKAMKLLEGEQYEEAVVLFDQLEGTQYEEEARKQRLSAIDLLARTSRSKAGHLFLLAKQSQDLDLQKKYLIESFMLLKGVMERYPDNQYADKIARNLEDVRAEIEKIYPEFLVEENLSISPPGSISGDKDYLLQEDVLY